jgi:SAM-dependent methyltransferase/uncharacterized protein YbaR (Trm112 family)
MFWWWTFENIVALLKPRNEDRLLDVGVGFGFDEKVIKARLPDIELYGIDIAPSMIASALSNSTPAGLAVAAAEELPLPADAFTRIVSREVIEHVLDPALFLRQVREAATHDARVVITTPNANSLAMAHLVERFFPRAKSHTPEYKDEHMTTRQLETLFVSCGFGIRERFFDCAGYFWLQMLFNTPLRPVVPVLAVALRRLEGHDFFSRLMCDQVKYVLTCAREDKPPTRPVEIDWICPECRGDLSRGQDALACERCHTSYDLIDGKAPVFIKDSEAAPSAGHQRTRAMGRRNAWVRRCVWVVYSLVYGTSLLVACATA